MEMDWTHLAPGPVQHHTPNPQLELNWNSEGKHKRSPPVTTWRRILDSELKTIRMSWEEAKKINLH